jgi:peptidoglycan/xylan/chitin deacetylase (PgdA/CDA1 family)
VVPTKALATLALVLAVAAISATATRLLTRKTVPAPLALTVQGRPALLPAGTTLAEATATLGLRPRAGELRDIAGRALRPDGDPGRLLVDGRLEGGRTLLRRGDRISVVNGLDRREARVSEILPVPAGAAGDPQFTLEAVPGRELVVRGAVSRELVSSRFRPTGTSRTPNAVALTFDDGPSPQYTPLILATLRRLHVHATFFVIGYLAQADPALVREELKLGMEVGNHSYNHPEVPPFGELAPRVMRDEIAVSANILSAIGIRPTLFRPPGGSFSPTLLRTVSALGERVVLWSVDPTDWTLGISSRQIVSSVLSAVRPGSIVILHDGGGDRSATLAALPAIVRGIRARGLRLVTLAPGPLTANSQSATG